MNISTIKGVRMEAIAACIPSNRIDNQLFAKEHFEEDLTSTLKAVGVNFRHIVAKEETTGLTLCVEAANSIMKNLNCKDEIGAIVYVTQTPDMLVPNNSTYVQHLLNLPSDVAAIDVNHSCPGYTFGLWNAALMCQNLKKKVLFLDGDVNSKYVSPWDKSTSLLFGDAGTATLLTPDSGAQDWIFTFNVDGSLRDSVQVKIGFKNLIKAEMLEFKEYEDGSKRREIDMYMDGMGVFDYEIENLPPVITDFMDELETAPEEYDKVLIHQANAFMLRKLTKILGFEKEQVPMSIHEYGNTSSACIPVTITSQLKDVEFDKVLMVGMGAGLASCIADISLKGMKNFGIKELDA